VARLREGNVQIDPAWKERVSKKYGLSLGEWKARKKKVCNHFFSYIFLV
jgi:hypothetical protein